MTRSCVVAMTLLILVAAGCGGDADSNATTEAAEEATTTTVVLPTTAAIAAPTTAAPTTASTTTATTTLPPPTTTTTTTAATTTTTATTTLPPPTTTTTTTAATTTTTAAIDYVALGSDLATNLGCRNCHSTDGSVGLGPSWAGLAGSIVPLADGSSVTASAGYLTESIHTPDAKIVAGFAPGIMQVVTLTDQEIQALVAYISTR